MQVKNNITGILFKLMFVLNIALLLLLTISAYSSHLSPVQFPILSNSGLAFPVLLVGALLFAIFWAITKVWKFHSIFWLFILVVSPQLSLYLPINKHKEAPRESIKILSYNVMNFNNLKLNEQGDSEILNYITEQDADIICIQEYASSTNSKLLNTKLINKAFRKYKYKSVISVGSKNSYNKIACLSKHPILKSERINYTSQYNGSSAHLIKYRQDTIQIVNNHLESNKITQKDRAVYEKLLKLEENQSIIKDTKGLFRKIIDASIIREQQALIIADYLLKNPFKYTIVCGDFNDSPLSRTNKILSKNLKSAFKEAGSGLGISYNRNMFYFRIDNILISNNIKAYNCIVDNSIKLSDHYPIICSIAFE